MGYKYKKIKNERTIFNEEKKRQRRILNTFLIYKIIEKKQTLLFYDESTIVMGNLRGKIWVNKTERPKQKIRWQNKFLKLNLIVGFGGLVSFNLTFGKFGSEQVFNFITSSLEEFKAK